MKFKLLVSYYGVDKDKEFLIIREVKRSPMSEEYDPQEGKRTLVFYFGTKATAVRARTRLKMLQRSEKFMVGYVMSEVWDG